MLELKTPDRPKKNDTALVLTAHSKWCQQLGCILSTDDIWFHLTWDRFLRRKMTPSVFIFGGTFSLPKYAFLPPSVPFPAFFSYL
jgi:hypothetical protein